MSDTLFTSIAPRNYLEDLARCTHSHGEAYVGKFGYLRFLNGTVLNISAEFHSLLAPISQALARNTFQYIAVEGENRNEVTALFTTQEVPLYGYFRAVVDPYEQFSLEFRLTSRSNPGASIPQHVPTSLILETIRQERDLGKYILTWSQRRNLRYDINTIVNSLPDPLNSGIPTDVPMELERVEGRVLGYYIDSFMPQAKSLFQARHTTLPK